jgi:flavin-dependent dehydrogenase
MSVREPDLVVVGGGPAGTTVASLVKKYAPSSRVVLVEQTPFPRHHIGESLVADVNRLLAELGVYEKIAAAGFLKKFGSTFVWGRDREPWSIEFQDLRAMPGNVPTPSYQTGHTWHVPRHAYDAILLDHARSLGVEVRSPVRAEITLEGDGPHRVQLSSGETLRPRFVVDATGQSSQLATRGERRRWDPELRNVAVYAYHRGAELDPRLSGTWDATRIAVVTVATGWLWYIPLERGLVSVGLVTSPEHVAGRGRELGGLLDEAIAGCVELAPLLARSERVRYGGSDADVLVVRDYCYSVSPVRGPGWALVGDAAGFVDPILSIGCYLAHTSGQWLAYVIGTLLADESADEELCWRAYEEQLEFQLAAFRRMTYVFYAFNDAKETWWWEAKKLLRQKALPRALEQKAAFLALATGYGINRPIVHEAISDFGVNIFDAFYRNLVVDESIRSEGVRQAPKQRFQRARTYRVEPWMVPIDGTGRMRAVSRLTFHAAEGIEAPSRLFLPPAHLALLERLDGRRVSEVLAELSPDDVAAVGPDLDAFLTGLTDLGVVARVP